MTTDEWQAFVQAGTRTGKPATLRRDGSPHVVPIRFVLAGEGTFVFSVGSTSAKAKAMQRDPRVALVVDDDTPPYGFVLVRGRVTLSDDVEAMLPWTTRMGARYMGQERADEFGRRNAVPGELLVRLRPDHVVADADVTG
jgi:PPOX class probable F420-dependent enzyme